MHPQRKNDVHSDPVNSQSLGGICHSEWNGAFVQPFAKLTKVPQGPAAFPKRDGQSESKGKKEVRQRGNSTAIYSGLPMSNKFITHKFKRRTVTENHYGREYKDSNYLLPATGDCFVVAGPNRVGVK